MNALVLYYSAYGNTFRLARAVAEGAARVKGADVSLLRVPELQQQAGGVAPERQRNASILQQGIPVARVEDLPEYDAIILGSPCRYGNMCVQMKYFLERTVNLWTEGALEGKIGGVFTCTATPHGGQETTLLSMIMPLLHLGMVVAGLPHTLRSREGFRGGGSPYGISATAGMHADQAPGEPEIEMARVFGEHIAGIAARVGKR